MHLHTKTNNQKSIFGKCTHRRTLEIKYAFMLMLVVPLLTYTVIDWGYQLQDESLPAIDVLISPVRAAKEETVEVSMEGRNVPPEAFNSPVAHEILRIALEEGFAWPDYLIRLSWCESRFNPEAIGDMNIYTPNGEVVRSRGLFQISAAYHPTVSDEVAFDIEESTRWTMWKINSGQQHLWSCDKKIR